MYGAINFDFSELAGGFDDKGKASKEDQNDSGHLVPLQIPRELLMHYAYVLLSEKDSKFYTGQTNDLKRRIQEHQSGNVRSTWNRKPLKLIYYEACLDEDDAKQREIYLKSGKGKKYIKNRLKRYLENLVTG